MARLVLPSYDQTNSYYYSFSVYDCSFVPNDCLIVCLFVYLSSFSSSQNNYWTVGYILRPAAAAFSSFPTSSPTPTNTTIQRTARFCCRARNNCGTFEPILITRLFWGQSRPPPRPMSMTAAIKGRVPLRH
jgi:hypothetical protein